MSSKKNMLPKEKIKAIKSGSAALSIGKKSLTGSVIEEIKKLLKKDKILKIKIQKSLLEETEYDRKSLAEKVVKKTDSVLLEIRGNTFIIYKN